MQILRAIIKLILFFVVASITILMTGIGRITIFENLRFYKWKNLITKWFALSSMKILGMELHIKGTSPDPPFFMTCNHLSYIDILPLWYCCRGTFIAKSDISNWPFFGFGAKVLGVLFINREVNRDLSRVNNLIRDQINEHQGIILFPEGTSSNGSDVLPFNPSLLNYPAKENIAVTYATIHYQTRSGEKSASEYICWWGDMGFFSHFFELLKMKRFYAKIVFGEHPVKGNDRKELARVLHQRVKEDFTPCS